MKKINIILLLSLITIQVNALYLPTDIIEVEVDGITALDFYYEKYAIATKDYEAIINTQKPNAIIITLSILDTNNDTPTNRRAFLTMVQERVIKKAAEYNILSPNIIFDK